MPELRGAIFDTESHGRFDLAIYDDGVLAVKGTYKGIAMRGAAAGSGGGFGALLAGRQLEPEVC